MEARNVRASLSLFHSEVGTSLGNEMYEESTTVSNYVCNNCSQLVKIVSEPEEWPVFSSYMEDIKILKESFLSS